MADNTKKSNIKDMRFGEMNFLGSTGAQATFDPNRVDIISVLQSSNISYYTANLLRGKRRWNAIVLRSTTQTHASVSSEFQRTYTAYERSNTEGKFVHFTYKIYIAELDGFKKIPEQFSTAIGGSKDSDSAALINLCRDAMAPLGQSYGAIDYGTPVEVVFADQERLRNPIIIDVHWKRRISLEAGKQPLWTHAGPRMTIGGGAGGAKDDRKKCAKMYAEPWGAIKTFSTPRKNPGNYAKYRPLAVVAATEYSVPLNLLLKLLDHEAGWDPNAKSHVYAMGMAQFMPMTALGYPKNEKKVNRLMWFHPDVKKSYQDNYKRIRIASGHPDAWAWLKAQPPDTWTDRRSGDANAELAIRGSASLLANNYRRFRPGGGTLAPAAAADGTPHTEEDAWIYAVAAYNTAQARVNSVLKGEQSLPNETCGYVRDIGRYAGSRNPFLK